MNMDDYLFWQNRYGAEGFIFGEEPCQFLLKCRELLPASGKALAIADGEGRNGVFLAECGLDVLSVDFSPLAQEKAARLAMRRGVNLSTRQADILDWDWPEAEYDVIAAIFFQFCGPAGRAKIFAGLKKALRPGGLLLLHGYRPEQLAYATGGPRVLENLYTEEMLRQDFADFSEIDIRSYDLGLEEGAAHKGLSALIDLTARKVA